jgi:hypothetical protein
VVARLLHTPPSLAARGFTRRREKIREKPGDLARLPPFSPSSPAVTCKTRKTQAKFLILFFFKICFSLLPFSALVLSDLFFFLSSSFWWLMALG